MSVYWVGIEFDGCSELGVEANDLSGAVKEAKEAVLEALYRGVDLWVARLHETGEAPGYRSEQTTVKWSPADEIKKNLCNGNN